MTADFLDLVTHGGQVEFSLYEIEVPKDSPIGSKTLAEADIRGTTGATVLAIRKADGTFNLQLTSSSQIENGDILVVLGTPDQIARFEQLNR